MRLICVVCEGPAFGCACVAVAGLAPVGFARVAARCPTPVACAEAEDCLGGRCGDFAMWEFGRKVLVTPSNLSQSETQTPGAR